MVDLITGLMWLVVGALALLAVIWLYFVIPAEMAKDRGRSAAIWVLIGLVFSPLLSIVLLWMMGPVAGERD